MMGTHSGRANNSFTLIFRAGVFCELTQRIMCQPLQHAYILLFNSRPIRDVISTDSLFFFMGGDRGDLPTATVIDIGGSQML